MNSAGCSFLSMAIRRPKLPKANAIGQAAVEIPKAKAEKAKAEKAVEVNQAMQAKDDILLLSKAIGHKLTDDQVKMLAEQIETSSIDTKRPITFYLTEACAPTGKDQQRIYDIIKKSQPDNGIVSICKADFSKMKRLAENMNNAIKDEAKRRARKEACDFYGLTFLAECFSQKEDLKLYGNGIGFGMDFGVPNGQFQEIKYKFDDFEEFDRFRLKYEDLKHEDLIDVRTAFDYKGDNAIGKMIGDM